MIDKNFQFSFCQLIWCRKWWFYEINHFQNNISCWLNINKRISKFKRIYSNETRLQWPSSTINEKTRTLIWQSHLFLFQRYFIFIIFDFNQFFYLSVRFFVFIRFFRFNKLCLVIFFNFYFHDLLRDCFGDLCSIQKQFLLKY